MDHDYYKILGVTSSADIRTIEAAYRRKASECHPDRGGTHEEMLLINEAWEVLSNPDFRIRYDESRRNRGGSGLAANVAADAQDARARAEHYPKKWLDFEKYLALLNTDFKRAEYGMGDRRLFPSTGEGISGIAFVAAGAILTPLLPLVIVAARYGVRGVDTVHIAIANPAGGVIVTLMLASIGALTGAHLHRWINFKILASNQSSLLASTKHTCRCPHCGQKLRVPSGLPELIVTCSKCKLKFSVTPNSSLPPFPRRQLFVIALVTTGYVMIPAISVWTTNPVDREYIKSLARIMQSVDYHVAKEHEYDLGVLPKQAAEELYQQFQAANSIKKLPTAGVTPSVVNAADAWNDAFSACFNARIKFSADSPEVSATATSLKMRRDGLFDTIGAGLCRVFINEFEHAKKEHDQPDTL